MCRRRRPCTTQTKVREKNDRRRERARVTNRTKGERKAVKRCTENSAVLQTRGKIGEERSVDQWSRGTGSSLSMLAKNPICAKRDGQAVM